MITTSPAPLTRLLRRANDAGQLLDALPMLTIGSRFLPAFRSPGELPGPPRGVLVSDGHARPQLICVPSFLGGSGPHQFVRLATAFARRARTSALVLPGFDRDGSVPATWTAALDALASAVRATAGGEPYVLVGHSIGGVVAHTLASHLERQGHPAAGVVLVDTLAPDPARQDAMLEWAMGTVLDRDPNGIAVNDDVLLAMGAYLRIFADWRPAEPSVPVLQVAADSPWPPWDVADTVTRVAAGHFSVLEEHAGLTAAAIETWLG
ncbi:alpha/beta fold hydrolase [Actinophytocola gossypii]|uniref:Alpha/beta fold hydrolase n=1 Tax=Actinophytocola gossypii TaxID=2812003 RepID=A0ABT2J743_9PSEU|nr:alpha/beta fold hydrolase [Actinophytocola gossypii]MCT2583670.1 alpha/beta fold hydrolase [Actinophytocola gossypii]